MKHAPPPPRTKILARDALLARHARPRDARVVFTNGCFDLLHPGHVEYLHAARGLGDLLVVGLNDDDSVRRLKGPGRPVLALGDRAFVLAGLAAVDVVTPFHEDTPRALIAALLPNVLVKGGDYAAEEVVGREEVEAGGGRVVIVPFRQGYSSSALMQRIRAAAAANPGDPRTTR